MKNKIIWGLFLLMSANSLVNCTMPKPMTVENPGKPNLNILQPRLNTLKLLVQNGKFNELLDELKNYKTQFQFSSVQYSFLLTRFSSYLSNIPSTWFVLLQKNSDLLNNFANTMISNPQNWDNLLNKMLKENPATIKEFYNVLDQNLELIVSLLNRVKDTLISNPSLKQQLITIVSQNPTKWMEYLMKIKNQYPVQWEKVRDTIKFQVTK